MLEPVPTRVPLVDGMRPIAFVSSSWSGWLTILRDALNRTAQRVGTVSLTAQGAAIAATAIPAPTLTTARYKLTYYLRVTRAATTSSSITLTIAFTDGGIACSQVFAAVTGNTTATFQTGTMMVLADTATTVNYSTAYASVGGTSMQYLLEISMELVP